jgi:hypothetical protein
MLYEQYVVSGGFGTGAASPMCSEVNIAAARIFADETTPVYQPTPIVLPSDQQTSAKG